MFKYFRFGNYTQRGMRWSAEMTKTRKWRGLHSNVDLTNQKSFVLFSPKKKDERKTIKMLFPLDQ